MTPYSSKAAPERPWPPWKPGSIAVVVVYPPPHGCPSSMWNNPKRFNCPQGFTKLKSNVTFVHAFKALALNHCDSAGYVQCNLLTQFFLQYQVFFWQRRRTFLAGFDKIMVAIKRYIRNQLKSGQKCATYPETQKAINVTWAKQPAWHYQSKAFRIVFSFWSRIKTASDTVQKLLHYLFTINVDVVFLQECWMAVQRLQILLKQLDLGPPPYRGGEMIAKTQRFLYYLKPTVLKSFFFSSSVLKIGQREESELNILLHEFITCRSIIFHVFWIQIHHLQQPI